MTLPSGLQIPYAKIVTAATDSTGTLQLEQLVSWLEDEWLATYDTMSHHKVNAMQFQDHGHTFLYDLASEYSADTDDRLVAAHGISIRNQLKRDKSRMQGFLGGRINIPGKGLFDKGHALAHGMGGGLDANLFPQKPELNLGRSEAGKLYRKMERYAAKFPGTFVFSRLIYDDNSWVPCSLEFGVLLPDNRLWVEWFENYSQS